jgi:hypothetical protein
VSFSSDLKRLDVVTAAKPATARCRAGKFKKMTCSVNLSSIASLTFSGSAKLVLRFAQLEPPTATRRADDLGVLENGRELEDTENKILERRLVFRQKP